MVNNTVVRIFLDTLNNLIAKNKNKRVSLEELFESALVDPRVLMATEIAEEFTPSRRKSVKKALPKKAKKAKKSKVGRPKGSKNKAKDSVDELYDSVTKSHKSALPASDEPKRKRGRPKGSKNKPKGEVPVEVTPVDSPEDETLPEDLESTLAHGGTLISEEEMKEEGLHVELESEDTD